MGGHRGRLPARHTFEDVGEDLTVLNRNVNFVTIET